VFYQITIVNFLQEVLMKKLLLVMFIFLCTAASGFCGEFEDILLKATTCLTYADIQVIES